MQHDLSANFRFANDSGPIRKPERCSSGMICEKAVLPGNASPPLPWSVVYGCSNS